MRFGARLLYFRTKLTISSSSRCSSIWIVTSFADVVGEMGETGVEGADGIVGEDGGEDGNDEECRRDRETFPAGDSGTTSRRVIRLGRGCFQRVYRGSVNMSVHTELLSNLIETHQLPFHHQHWTQQRPCQR